MSGLRPFLGQLHLLDSLTRERLRSFQRDLAVAHQEFLPEARVARDKRLQLRRRGKCPLRKKQNEFRARDRASVIGRDGHEGTYQVPDPRNRIAEVNLGGGWVLASRSLAVGLKVEKHGGVFPTRCPVTEHGGSGLPYP